MTDAENKAIASRFFTLFNAHDIEGALGTMASDATWLVPGKPGTHPFVGMLSMEQVGRLFHRMVDQTKHGLRMTVKSLVAEGDKVALEMESYGELKNGRIYQQQYHLLMEIKQGKISAVREYLDTQHVMAVWFQE